MMSLDCCKNRLHLRRAHTWHAFSLWTGDAMPVTEADIYKLTAKGSNELKGGATGLTPHELELIVLIDGRRQVSAIMKLATIGDPAEIGGLLDNLLRKGFIAVASPMEETDLRLQYFFSPAQSPQP